MKSGVGRAAGGHALRKFRPLAYSLTLHAVAAVLAMWLVHAPAPRETAPIELVDLPPGDSPAQSSPESGAVARSAPRGRGSQRLSLSQLGLGNPLAQPTAGSPDASSAPGGNDDPESSARALLQAGSGRGALLPSYVHSRIDSVLAYPQELVEQQLSGEVRVRLIFDGKGNYLEDASVFEIATAPSRYFKVYLRELLRRVWASPIPARVFPTAPDERRSQYVFQCRFTFQLIVSEEMGGAIALSSLEAPSGSAGFNAEVASIARVQNATGRIVTPKLLGFKRTRYRQGLAWKLGPFVGYGITPAVGLDPTWIADHVQSLFDPKKRARLALDPLQKYRDSQDY